MPIRLTTFAQGTRLKIPSDFLRVIFVVACHERILFLQNESSGDAGNRTPVQKVVAKEVYIHSTFLV